jgi:hypothetical protein
MTGYEMTPKVAAMNKPVHSPRWYAPWRQVETRAADDPADVGTAFGLELSLAAEAAPSRTAVSPSRRQGWMQRLSARRRASVSAG